MKSGEKISTVKILKKLGDRFLVFFGKNEN
jgi:hypothetical protein